VIVIASGQRSPVSGWYVDQHGHCVFLRRGEPASLCPILGPASAVWRLVRSAAPLPHG